MLRFGFLFVCLFVKLNFKNDKSTSYSLRCKIMIAFVFGCHMKDPCKRNLHSVSVYACVCVRVFLDEPNVDQRIQDK